MPLLLVTGRANAGKTGDAYDAIRTAARAGAPVLILPSDPDVARARRELALEMPLGLRVTTFARHAATTWTTHGDGRQIVTPGQRQLLLSQVEIELGNATPGLAALASQAIDMLADGLGFEWRNATGAGERAARGLRDHVELYARMLDQHELVELSEVYFLLSECGAFGGDPLVIHRFTDLTIAQERFVVAASEKVQVVVTLPWEDGFAPTAALDPLVARLAPLGRMIVRDEDPRETDEELLRLSAELFGSPRPQPLRDAVGFAEVEGEEAEADRIAAEVADAIASGIRPGQIAVVFREPTTHLAQMKAAFESLGIAADYDALTPFSATAFGTAFLQALKFVNTGNTMALLGFSRSAFSSMPRSARESFERMVRATGANGKEPLVQKMAEFSSSNRRVIGALEDAARSGVDADMSSAILAAAHWMLGQAHAGTREEDHEGLEEDVRAIGALTGVLEGAVALGGVPPTTRALEIALSHVRLGPGQVEREGRVQVTSVERARGRRFEVVVLGGLHAGSFPRMVDEPFAPSGAAGAFLEQCGLDVRRSLGADYERLLLYQVITRPRKRLALVRRRTDSDGVPLAPSVFWEELLDFYRPAQEGALSPEGVIEIGLMECGLGPHSSASVRKALRTAALCGNGDLDLRVAMALRRVGAGAAVISDPDALVLLESRYVFSVSEIEVYLACPLKWFYGSVVSPRELDTGYDARERGRLTHEMLRVSYEAIVSEIGQGRVTEDVVRRAQEIADREMVAALAGQPEARDFDEEQERRELRRAILKLIEMDATQLPKAFKPRLLEWEFGLGSGVDVGGFALRGRIDRVDTDGEHAVIIDYKSGAVPARARLLGEGRIQAQLYAEVVRLEQGLKPVGSVYWSLKGDKPRGLIDATCLEPGRFTSTDCGDAAGIETDIKEALQLAATAVCGMRSGDLTPPPRAGACEWCSATAMCGRGT